MTIKKLKCAVVGTGYLGKFHAQKYALLPACELIAVVDSDMQTARRVADEHAAQALTDYRDLLDEVDAVSVVVPTCYHHAVARDFLSSGVHVLVEKPITATIEEADDLIALAKANQVILQVGHLERFNPAVLALKQYESPPVFIESHRLSPFNPRANDVSVVLDLMIHDIDIILALVNSEIERIEASGTAVLTQNVDIANARLVFQNGCVANVTASRISLKTERKMRLFCPQAYLSIDFQNKLLTRHQTGAKEMFPGIPEIITEESVFENGDALLAEIEHFVQCIHTDSPPLVPGEAGKRALQTAIEISRILNQ